MALREQRVGFGFNGATTYIYAPFDWFGFGDWTIALWFYHMRAASEEMLRQAFTPAGKFGYFVIMHRIDNYISWIIRASNTNNYYAFYSSIAIPPGRWGHVAVRRQGTIINMFVNGIKDAKYATVPLSEEMTWDGIQIGRIAMQGWWLGLIGPVMIYKRALSDAEIVMLYNGYIIRDGLALYFDPSIPLRPDGKVEDLSGNGRHGTIYGPVRVGVYRAVRQLAPTRVLTSVR